MAPISMIKPPIKLALILIACLCMAYFTIPAIADTPSSTPSSTSIIIEVFPNGDAHWTTMKKIPLNTSEDIAGWDSTAAAGTDSYRVEFETNMTDYVAKISSDIGRPMMVQDVNVSVERSSPYDASGNNTVTDGIIKYEFTWTGFAMVNGDVLEVGDAFVDGFLLNKDDTINFILPPGYTITSISPAFDEKKDTYQPQITWTGKSENNTDPSIRLFSSGEPSITMHKISAPVLSFEWWVLIPTVLISLVLGFGAAYFLLRKEKPQAPVVMPRIPDIVAVPDAGAGTVEPPAAPIVEYDEGRYMSDEERVVKYLEESGGQMFQSDLVKKTDFSKSKLSMVLSDLKEKGTIIKIKKGKENLIRLNKPAAGDNADEPDN